ncbi:DsbE family thiol:disulfide interchange protein [Comamonas sp. CMM02]|jgi:cytochrome c biogenesis protein CcmG/thiol:disulfide interchange protein DsbE|uniref:DsbE family thiol:disulfide interchange protein n=1 Tax=Comamonas sp. CMM02 TaxID=2769307 RepID=UPI0017871910|nr:DsbE family thiol:disulfide interchange protein [Comamonas sp. CMM02]MBD9402172.1 DsbE family thiol:disulfide interchange protein [Comamonas sp. CMM02]
MMRFMLPLAVFLGLAVMLGLGLQRDPRALESALLDQPIPVFDLPLLGQSDGRLTPQTLRGKVWLLNVWASWCAPCRQELPILVEMSRKDQVAIYGLNYKDQSSKAQALLRVAGNPYVGSAVDADGRVGMDFGIHAVPETFVIDAQGRVRYRHLGPVTQQVWEEKIMPVVRAVQ